MGRGGGLSRIADQDKCKTQRRRPFLDRTRWIGWAGRCAMDGEIGRNDQMTIRMEKRLRCRAAKPKKAKESNLALAQPQPPPPPPSLALIRSIRPAPRALPACLPACLSLDSARALLAPLALFSFLWPSLSVRLTLCLRSQPLPGPGLAAAGAGWSASITLTPLAPPSRPALQHSTITHIVDRVQ